MAKPFLPRVVCAAFCAALLALARTAPAEDRAISRLSFSPCGGPIERPVGVETEMELEVLLDTFDNPEPGYGAQGWSIGILAEDATIRWITTKGTFAAEVTDDPPGLREGGFERSELASDTYGPCEGKSGAISAVVLSFTIPAVLPAEGPCAIARIAVAAPLPEAAGETRTARVSFVEGCRGAGGPVGNYVTRNGTTQEPERASCDLEIRATEARFIRGDANDDGKVDMSDPMAILGCGFLWDSCPSCRDAADSNDDGRMDVSDAIHILGFLFLGGEPPAPPGPRECATDPTEDDLPECRATACTAP